MTAAKDRLATLLGGLTTPGAFSAQRTVPVDDLHLEVRGVGRILFPLPKEQAAQLCGVGRPAMYGRGEKTLLDPRVRDTWEIPKSRVKIDKRRWAKTFLPVLERLRADLGMPSGCELKAELHSMLVYGPGQFFVQHQDSEKADAMVGSLVVTLPSSFKGGALVVKHAGETATYRSSKKSLSFVTFYADCLHEVRPVTSGYRVTLTYNLLLHGDTASADPPPGLVDPLAACINQHFGTLPASARRTGVAAPADPPNRLVYLLDHEYTARGLSWSRLKGSDARRAAALRAAAAQAGCEVVLALADVHETWSCMGPEWEEPWYGRSRGRRWDDWDEDLDEEDAGAGEQSLADQDEYQLEELVDWDVTLDCWIDAPDGQAKSVSLSIAPSEVCATVPSVQLRPYDSEHEGYMGNYGNTMDRWYHRAALVLWPRQRSFAMRAEASPAWALETLSARLRANDAVEARDLAGTLAPFWAQVAGGEHPPAFLSKALRVAHGLDEPATAAMLLKPFRVETLTRRHAAGLAALVERYGEGWARDVLQGWFGRGRPWAPPKGPGRSEWISSLPRLCEALQASGDPGLSTARLLVQESWGWLREAVAQGLGVMPPSCREEALGELGQPIAAVLRSAALTGVAALGDEAIRFLCRGNDDLTGCLMRVLRAARALAPAGHGVAGIDAIEDHCARRLKASLAGPPRDYDDWSIELPGGCRCELCTTLGEFLSDRARRSFEWPLAKEGRRHIHRRIDAAELPVRHETRRTGRPYALVLTKTEALFERDRQARRRDGADLAWLTGGSGGPGPSPLRRSRRSSMADPTGSSR